MRPSSRAWDHTPGTVPLLLKVAVSMLLGCPRARDENVHVLRSKRAPVPKEICFRYQTVASFIFDRTPSRCTTPRRSASMTAIGTAQRSQRSRPIRTCGSSSASSLYRLERVVLATQRDAAAPGSRCWCVYSNYDEQPGMPPRNRRSCASSSSSSAAWGAESSSVPSAAIPK